MKQGLGILADNVPHSGYPNPPERLPGVPGAVVLKKGHLHPEKLAKFPRGEQLPLRPIGEDPSLFHHDDAVDFRQDVRQMVRDHQDARSLLCDTPECLAEFALRGQIKSVRWLVEQQHFRLMDQCPGDHDATLLAG